MAISLASISPTNNLKPPRILLHGVPGVGKTTFASQMPSPIFIQCEDGLGNIQVPSFPLAHDYNAIIGALHALLHEDHAYSTVVIDTVDWLEPIIAAETCRRNGWSDLDAPGYGKGPYAALAVWTELLDKFTELRDRKQMVIMMISHTRAKRFNDPENGPYDKYRIKLRDGPAALVVEYADIVLFANFVIDVEQTLSSSGKRAGTSLPQGFGQRVLYTQERPAYLAKNRYGMPHKLEMSWASVSAAITAKNPS